MALRGGFRFIKIYPHKTILGDIFFPEPDGQLKKILKCYQMLSFYERPSEINDTPDSRNSTVNKASTGYSAFGSSEILVNPWYRTDLYLYFLKVVNILGRSTEYNVCSAELMVTRFT